MKKKAMSQLWWIIAAAIIALIIVMLILVWFKGSGGKAFEDLDTRINQLKDDDNDKVANLFDKCPETPPDTDVDEKGCPQEKIIGVQ
ncbi:TPA: hypothetical protein HA241_01280 [Candidatus Woesearchaeota archaeon]|nr:hypothetical protein [Candidatus Woesearchaeota archaeon]